jgi:O-antigen/teichoic acid export membrane protein
MLRQSNAVGLAAARVDGWSTRLIGRAFRGSFARNVSHLFAGTALAQLLSVAVAPILTHLYEPADFGVLGMYIATLTVATTVASLRYENAIPVATGEREAVDLGVLCAIALSVTTAVLAAIAFCLPLRVWTQCGVGGLFPYRPFLPLGYALLGSYAVLSAFATRDGAFGVIARTRFSQALCGPAVQVGVGILHGGVIGLVLGFVAAQSNGLVVLARHVVKRYGGSGRASTAASVWQVARRYRAFPLISTWGALAEAIGGALALYLLLGGLYGSAAVGLVFLSERIAGRPLRMVVSSLAPVFLGEVGQMARTDPARLQQMFFRVSLRHSLLAATWLVTINAAAGWLYPTLFGREWAGGVDFLHALSVWYFCATVVRTVSATLQVLERQVYATVPQVVGPVLGAVAFWGCWRAGYGAVGAIWAYSICQGMAFAAMYVAMVVVVTSHRRRWQAAAH